MTPDIIVSVPHSGTRFLKERLSIAHHCHTHTNWRKLYEEIQGKHIIVPLRRPDEVWRSWCRRRDPDSVLMWVGAFFQGWCILHTLDQMYELDFICIDKQEDLRISDWSKVGDGDENGPRWKLLKVDLRPLYKLPFVQEHYSSWAK